MGWKKDAITDGEIDALSRAAAAACNEDTCYPLWRGSRRQGRGECLNIAKWLVSRLGGQVGAHKGHYVWLTPDRSYLIDLTGDHGGHWKYASHDGTYTSVRPGDTDRSRRFIKRADRIFDSLDTIFRLSLDYAGDAYPAEETQRQDDRDRFNDSWMEPEQYWHDESDPTTPEGVYQFVYANGQLEISPNHSHHELAGHAGITDPQVHNGPFAAGHVAVTNGRATWEVQANVNLHSFFRILKDATKDYGWQWGGMTDAAGQPIIEQFAPKKSARILHYVLLHDHLYLGRTSAADLAAQADRDDSDGRAVSGTLHILGDRAWVHSAHVAALPHLFDWAADNDLRLYGANDNVIKTIPYLQEEDNYKPDTLESPNPEEPPAVDERLPSGLYRCPGCSRLFPNWSLYSQHRPECAEWADPDHMDNGDRGFPPGEHDPIYGDGAHYHERRVEPGVGTVGKIVVLLARTWKEAARVDGFMRYATAFNYDNDDYSFYVAYRNGDPLGYAAVGRDGNIQMMQSAVENQGVGKAIFNKVTRHFDSLYTHAAHTKTEALLKRTGWVQSSQLKWRWSKDQAPTDLLDAPVPFIYDVQEDKIHVGHPGARTSDIPGRFTPGGIVEGTYEPGGKVIVRSLTSIPYTVRHLIELWYYSHPQLEVKSVHLQDDAGKDTRLASNDIGSYVKQLAMIDPTVHRVAHALMGAGGHVFVVGGAVRDALMGREPHDLDLMVTGIPPQDVASLLESLPGRMKVTGNDFSVFRYAEGGHPDVEIAMPRTERSTGPGHKDFDVQADHTMKPEDDFYRRDFTANAMGVDLANGRLIDPFGGATDITSGTLRTLHDKSLVEDPLRIARALVAHARHGFNPDEATRAQMSNYAHALEHLPAERVQAELDKLFAAENPAAAIRLAHDTGVLGHILPEVEAAFGFDQNNPHHELELGDHLLKVLERISHRTDDPDLRLAALLHDIGKPGSAWTDPETGSSHFYAGQLPDGTPVGANHEDLGAELAASRLGALKYPTDRIKRMQSLVAGHMFPGFSTPKGARRFMSKYNPHAEDLLTLRWADQGGKSPYPSNPALSVDTQRRLVAQVRDAGEPTDVSQLAINGNDLITAGIPPSPLLGQILSYLAQQVIDDPSLNDRETLLRLASNYATLKGDEEPIPQGQDGQAQEEVQLRQARQDALRQASEGDEDPQVVPEYPEFPDIDDAVEAHDAAVEMSGQPYAALRDPQGLQSALGRAENHWHYSDPSQPYEERLMQSAAMMGHGVAQRQAFGDGNKRTAYWLMHGFLANNGMPHVLREDDPEMASTIVGWGEGTHTPDHMADLWRQRHQGIR